MIRDAHIVSHQGTCSTGCDQTSDKQICGIEQNICCNPSFTPRQSMYMLTLPISCMCAHAHIYTTDQKP
uniref:Uncharacterized protein n=1 Tax=Octopus bimaculoides TaxID=37653 RepID=A0A0L8HAP1_OCTBM